MSNTLGGINLAAIAEETLATLENRMFLFDAFTTDFSNEIATRGESISTRVATAMTAVNVANGYTAQDVTSTAKTVTLNCEYGFPMAFLDSEVSKAGDVNWLKNVFIRPAVNSVLRQMVSNALALVTNAAFSSYTTIAAANFSYANVVGLDVSLETANALQPRSLIITPTYAATLRKDSTIAAAIQGGNPEMIAAGRLGQIAGFNVIQYNTIPNNSENLAGIALAPQALLIAARQPAVPQFFSGEVVNAQDPSTGLPLQFRQWYSENTKRHYISVEAFYGVAVGVAGNLNAIRTAAP
jgi:hypothetical protein